MTSLTKQQLLEMAKNAQQKSYSPYSSFKVGSAIVADDDSVYLGCNVENAAYPLGQCAEASAIGNMVLGGNGKIKEIMIVSPNDEICPPCGGCRQKISEFALPDTQVHMATSDGDITTVKFQELLPYAFDIEDVK